MAVAALIIASTAPPSASAVELSSPQLHPIWNEWVGQAKVPMPEGRVKLRLLPCPDFPHASGCTSRSGRDIFVHPSYLQPGFEREHRDEFGLHPTQHLLYHELGHVFDSRHLDARERRAFRHIIGDRHDWQGVEPRFAFNPPFEKFAEAYAMCALGLANGRTGFYGYRAPRSKHARVCALIEAAADKPPRARGLP